MSIWYWIVLPDVTCGPQLILDRKNMATTVFACPVVASRRVETEREDSHKCHARIPAAFENLSSKIFDSCKPDILLLFALKIHSKIGDSNEVLLSMS